MRNKVTITLPTIPLTLIFIILKVTETIDWSWLWVLSPLWLPFALFFGGIVIVFGAILFMALLAALITMLD